MIWLSLAGSLAIDRTATGKPWLGILWAFVAGVAFVAVLIEWWSA